MCGEKYWKFAPGEFVHLPTLCTHIGQVLEAGINDAGELTLYVAAERMFEEELQRL